MLDFDTLLNDEGGIYLTEFPEGWKFYWRLLTLSEYRKLVNLRASDLFHPFYFYRKVFDRCYLGNPLLINQDMPLFVPVSIGQLIMYLSGDCNSETIREDLEIARSMYQGKEIVEQMKLTILSAYPNYSPDDLERWNRPQLIKKFVQAESTLVQRYPGNFTPLDISKIVSGNEIQNNTPSFETVNTAEENSIIQNNMSVWDIADMNEQAVKEAKTRSLSKDDLRKLDRARRG